jgi:hypothetical protein
MNWAKVALAVASSAALIAGAAATNRCSEERYSDAAASYRPRPTREAVPLDPRRDVRDQEIEERDRCRISIPGGNITEVPLAPSEDSIGSDVAFEVHHGTLCEALSTGPLNSQVRIKNGPEKDRAGWLPTEWRFGR